MDIHNQGAPSTGIEDQGPKQTIQRGLQELGEVLTGMMRFFAGLIGIVIVGAIANTTAPDTIESLALVVAIVAFIALLRPIPLGWLQYRAAVSGILIGTLSVMAMPDGRRSDTSSEGTVDTPVAASGSADTPINVKPKAEPAKKPAPTGKYSPYKDPAKQVVWIDRSKAAVRQRLREPSSATFKNVVFRTLQGKAPMVCGEVNGKNGFGGYTGYQRFVAAGDQLAYLESDFAAGEFAEVWNTICLR